MKGISVLVSGGAGFIGSHITQALVNQGAKVRVLDNFSSGNRENLTSVIKDVEIYEGDIRNAVACRNACRGVQAVFHLAAYISVPGSVRDPVLADSVNIGGTLNMLMAAKEAGTERFVFSSSAAVYGDTSIVPTPETTLPTPLSPYGIEKLYGEHMARLYYTLHGMETVSLRYFNVFGPGQNPKSEYAAVIPKFITRLLANEQAIIYGDGMQSRDFLFVGDVVKANLLASQTKGAGGKIFNIAGGKETNLLELHEMIRRGLGVDSEPVFQEGRPGDIRQSIADTKQAKEVLGFAPEHDLPYCLARTCEAYRSLTTR